MNHDAVAEVAVTGLPDDERGEIVAAFVKPINDVAPDETLAGEIKTRVRSNLSKYEYPRKIVYVDDFRRTASGMVQRFELREEYA